MKKYQIPKYQNPSSLVKDLFKGGKNKNDKVEQIVNESIKLMENISIKEIPENENSKKQSILLKKFLILMKSKKVMESEHRLATMTGKMGKAGKGCF